MLWLNHTDIQSVTSLSIDDNSYGTYTSITSTYVHVYEQGYIVLDRDAEITTFTGGHKTVKITYTYGNSMPSQSVKEMAILMVANLLHYDPVREDMINRIFQRVRWSGPKGLA